MVLSQSFQKNFNTISLQFITLAMTTYLGEVFPNAGLSIAPLHWVLSLS